MKRHGLFLVTALSLVFSAICMARAGWFTDGKANRGAARSAQVRTQGRAFDPFNTQAAWRYRRGQASNWRSVMMYR